MYADEVHPHRTHQYTDLTMDVGAEKLQRPVHRLTRRGRREHRARMPEPRLHPAAYNIHRPRHQKPLPGNLPSTRPPRSQGCSQRSVKSTSCSSRRWQISTQNCLLKVDACKACRLSPMARNHDPQLLIKMPTDRECLRRRKAGCMLWQDSHARRKSIYLSRGVVALCVITRQA